MNGKKSSLTRRSMEREENFQTTLGIDTPASNVLWEKLSEDSGSDSGSDRERNWCIKFIAKYKSILNRIHPKDIQYLGELHLKHYINKAHNSEGWDNLHATYLNNIMQTLLKQRMKQ